MSGNHKRESLLFFCWFSVSIHIIRLLEDTLDFVNVVDHLANHMVLLEREILIKLRSLEAGLLD